MISERLLATRPTRRAPFGEGRGCHTAFSTAYRGPNGWRKRRVCHFQAGAELMDLLRPTSVKSGVDYWAYTKVVNVGGASVRIIRVSWCAGKMHMGHLKWNFNLPRVRDHRSWKSAGGLASTQVALSCLTFIPPTNETVDCTVHQGISLSSGRRSRSRSLTAKQLLYSSPTDSRAQTSVS